MTGSPLLATTVATFYWQLPIVIVLISLVYSATRYDDWGSIFLEAWRWGLRMAVFLVGIAAVLLVSAVLGWGAPLAALLVAIAGVLVVLALWGWGLRRTALLVGVAAVLLIVSLFVFETSLFT
jgi:hypothetical protein